jgi:CHAT domain-containing protein
MCTSRSASRGSLWLLIGVTASSLTPFLLRAEPPAELTKPQQEQRKERERLEAQAKSREWWAGVYQRLDNIAAARKARQEVLTLRIKIHGEKHWKVTDARLALADVEILERLTARQRQRLAEAGRLDEEALALYQRGRYREALAPARRAVEIEKQVRGDKHLDYAISLNSLAVLHYSLGDYTKAEPLYQQAREIRQRLLGEKHPDYAQSLNNLAQLCKSVGDYAGAERNLREARDIFQQTLGETHADYAVSLDNLAVLYDSLGDYARAEPLYRQARDIRRQTLGEKHLDYANSLNNLAALSYLMGDFAKAEPMYRQALAIYKQTRSEKHPRYATTLSNLAHLLYSQGEYARAELLYQEAREVRKQALGEKHPAYAGSLNNLAQLHYSLGDYAKAEPLYLQALDIRRQALGVQHPDYAVSLDNLAGLYAEMGDFTKAESRQRESLDIFKQALEGTHPVYVNGLHHLGMLYWSRGDAVGAEEQLRQVLALSRGNLELASAIQSQRQQLAMLDNLRRVLDTYLSLAVPARQTAERQYEPVLAWKGAVSLRQRNQRLSRRHPELAADFVNLDRTAARLATLALAVPDPKRLEAHRRQIQQLTEDKERQESRLAGLSADFRNEKERPRLTPAQLQAVLPKEAVLLDFLEYTHFTPPAEKKGKYHRERRLVAFVVRRDGLARVDLGPSKDIQEAIAQWCLALQRRYRTKGDDDLGAAVRRLVWQPLEEHLHGVKVVLVSPDGALARVPFAALPSGKKDSYLLEDVAVAIVPVPQLLPQLLTPPPAARKEQPSLMVVGDVSYGGAVGGGEATADSRAAPRASAGVLFQWKALENTRDEVAAIKDSFQRRLKGRVTDLREEEASEAEVRRQAPRHRYLHFATHGFFAPKQLRSALADVSRGDKTDSGNLFGNADVAGFHPGLLSGLVLAGANRPVDATKDDGILTAMEVETLDLTRVELATLSACETGLGEQAGGEGLLGLQRAFQVAGARSVVAGLWQVDDKATRDLMTRFYENLWKKKLPKLEALRQAQLWMLTEGAKRGMIDVKVPRERLAKEDGRLPPYYWAAFALSGDWR